jgi:hypothetical protein
MKNSMEKVKTIVQSGTESASVKWNDKAFCPQIVP